MFVSRPPGEYRQHSHVNKVSYRALRGGLLGKYHIDDQQPRRRAHDAMAVSQYRPCALVVPIVDNVLEDILNQLMIGVRVSNA